MAASEPSPAAAERTVRGSADTHALLGELRKDIDSVQKELSCTVLDVPFEVLFDSYATDYAHYVVQRHQERARDLEGQLDRIAAEQEAVRARTQAAIAAAKESDRRLELYQERCEAVRAEKVGVVDMLQRLMEEVNTAEAQLREAKEENARIRL